MFIQSKFIAPNQLTDLEQNFRARLADMEFPKSAETYQLGFAPQCP